MALLHVEAEQECATQAVAGVPEDNQQLLSGHFSPRQYPLRGLLAMSQLTHATQCRQNTCPCPHPSLSPALPSS